MHAKIRFQARFLQLCRFTWSISHMVHLLPLTLILILPLTLTYLMLLA